MLGKSEINEIRKDFPYLSAGEKIIYFDNGATTQKPIQVIKALEEYYSFENGNPHRGAHRLAMAATEVLEGARGKIASFIGADPCETVFVRNATEGLNLIAYSWAVENLKPGDEILISIMEHHSNLVTWQFVAEKTGCTLRYMYIDDERQIPETEWKTKISEKTKLLSLTMASNVVGTMPDMDRIVKYAREKSENIVVIADASQYIPHNSIDLTMHDFDFLVFSGHKMLSAMGIGVLYGKKKLLNSMKPFMYGGDMIEYVFEDRTSFLDTPQRFEAGTLNVGGAKSLVDAIKYIEKIGIENIEEYERSLTDYCYDRMAALEYLDIYTTRNPHRSPLVSFNFKDIHPHDTASIMNEYGIAIRSGHHCAQPLHRYMGCQFSCRASFSFYNTFEEIDYFIDKLPKVREVMGYGK